MGNNSGAITINLNRNDLFYFTNEIVSGNVNLNIKEKKIEANEIFIRLIGEIGYTTTHTVSNGHGGSTTQTEYHHIPFYSIKIPFAKAESGEKELTFYEGEYLWPFEIPLTNYLPPSVNKPESYPHCKYYLEVVIDKPWYKRNIRQRKYLTIYPHVNLLENPQCLTSSIFGNSNRQDINLKGTINKLGYVPRESIILSLQIHNPQQVLIKHINLTMFQFFNIQNYKRQNILCRATLPKILNLRDQYIEDTFSILIPSNLIPPTYQFGGGIKALVSVENSYLLRLIVKVEGIFTNFNVNIPIIIGTEPHPDLNQQPTSNSLIVSYSLDTEQSNFHDDDDGDDDPPPSYESVVGYEKESR